MTMTPVPSAPDSNWPMNPVQDFLDGLTHEEIRIMWSFMSLQTDRDRGAMNELAGIYGTAFWDVMEKVDALRDRYNCPPEVIRGALKETLEGKHVSEAMLHAYALPRPKPKKQEVVADTRQKARRVGIGAWLSQLLGKKN